MLGQMKTDMVRGGLDQLSRTKRLDDGTVVTVQSMFGNDTISIGVPKYAQQRRVTPSEEVIEDPAPPAVERILNLVDPVDPPRDRVEPPTPVERSAQPAITPGTLYRSPLAAVEDAALAPASYEEPEIVDPINDDEKEPAEYKYESNSYCIHERDKVATSQAFYATNSFFQERALMVDRRAVYYLQAARAASTMGTIYVLDGETLAIVNSMALTDMAPDVAMNSVSLDPPRVIVFDLHNTGGTSYAYGIRSIDMSTGSAAMTNASIEANFAPIPTYEINPCNNGMVLAYRGNANTTELLSPVSLAASATVFGDSPPPGPSGYTWLGVGVINQTYFAGNGVWAVYHGISRCVEVVSISGGTGFTTSTVPINYPQIAVKRDRKTVYAYNPAANDLRVYKNEVWSSNIAPQASATFRLLYDPVSDSIAISPINKTGARAWIVGATNCLGGVIQTFSVDVSVGGVNPAYSDQFLDGAIITQTEDVVPAADRPSFNQGFKRVITKHTIGVLRQKRIVTYEKVSSEGGRTPIGQAEYVAGGGIQPTGIPSVVEI